jgi:hypothetical protein
LAPLSALTALTRLDALSSDITDECSALLRLPSLASLTIYSISLTAPIAAAGVLPQLTYLEVFSSGCLPHLLPLLKLQELQIPHTADMSTEDAASLVTQISKQTSLTRLELWRLSHQQMQQVVTRLKNLQSFDAPFADGETSETSCYSCLAACAALAELPLLRGLTLLHVPQPAHLAMLMRCERLEVLRLTWPGSARGVSTGLLAALLCKPGMRRLQYPRRGSAAVDKELLSQMAARVGVELLYVS